MVTSRTVEELSEPLGFIGQVTYYPQLDSRIVDRAQNLPGPCNNALSNAGQTLGPLRVIGGWCAMEGESRPTIKCPFIFVFGG